MTTEYTAKLVRINDPYMDREGNTGTRDIIGIYTDGVCVKLVAVESSEDPAGYDDAVVEAIGSHDFMWVEL